MSHVAGVECIVTDLDALKVAGEKLGFEFLENQKTHKWYGSWLNDWRSNRAASQKGFDPAKFGKCDHAMRIKGDKSSYEIGVTARAEGDGYNLVYDTFGSGRNIEKLAGEDLVSLRNEVAYETASRLLQRRGYRVSRQDVGAQIRLTANQ